MKSLAVGVPFFNPFKNYLMEQNLINTVKHLLEGWGHVFVIEAKYPWSKTMEKRIPKKAKYIQFKAESVFFHKERMMNVASKEILKDYENLAAFDADILFEDKFWPQRILSALLDFDLVQCFDRGVGIYKRNMVDFHLTSCMFNWLRNKTYAGSPGGAWAGNKKFWKVGLFDSYILGSNDSCLFDGITGRAKTMDKLVYKNTEVSPQMRGKIIQYTDSMEDVKTFYVKQQVNFQFHTTAEAKRYHLRHVLMSGFDPDKELTINPDGLYEWTNPESVRAILMRQYFYIKDHPEEEWTTKVKCEVVKETTTTERYYKRGEKITLPIDKINNNFKIVWI